MSPQHPHDEELLAALLKAADRDVAPPDHAALERLRAQSAEAFRTAAGQKTALVPASRRTLRRFVTVAAGLAAVVLVGLGLSFWMTPRSHADTFARVLQNVADAGAHLQVTHQGETGEVWVRKDRLRRDRADGTYEISDQARLWVVDEKENRAASRKTPYFHGGESPNLDLLPLLGVRDPDSGIKLAEQRPAGRVQRDGAEYLVYRVETPWKEGTVQIEALVDPATLLLHSATARVLTDGKAKPVADLAVVDYKKDVPEEKFVVKDTLTEDGRVGKLADVQGVVSLKPVLYERWTPVAADTLLRPGDWVRTDVRGANAALLRLVKQTRLIIGPGSLVEVVSPTQVRVHQGEVEATVPAGDNLEIVSLNGQKVAVKGKLLYRFEEERFTLLEKEPAWLKGFKGAIPQESVGSLVAKVDGRNVPLSVGYHKVTVEIRDQIARTVIEESFVNHTDGVLEGVFNFPLPQDASISGFGMWIGDNLVEADVVEKQRAREIYEIILHEKRDPGLLEWSGGNIFKARVYPIWARSEKRIKITYTQVLPLRGNSYRYSYGLQSEMLKQNPLRQLDIDVKVSSAVPLKSVTSPTHMTRNEQTGHAAHLEFSAQEYVPARDFEVVVEVEGKQSEVVVIPHRRGDDGYFLLQVLAPLTPQPPLPQGGEGEKDKKTPTAPIFLPPLPSVGEGGRGGEGGRALLPNSQPLRLLVLADTSASMDQGQRLQQAAFLAALLGSLTPKDTVNVACCDVECDWAFDKPQPATYPNLQAIRQFVAGRVSLGWTDLDRAFASAFRQAEPGTHVIYLGDGIPTTGNADPVAFVQRLRRLYQEQGKGCVGHSVALGSSFEPGVMQAVGALGGGSTRRITGEQGPAAVARELLGEIARPALRDVKVEFAGLRTARVYPEQLPNLPAGSQEIILGRYLPEGKDQAGEVIVTGKLGDRPVRYTAPVVLKDAEAGNSFIPRLWARMHLDKLLEGGATDTVKDEVIALSEEYQIITPYTSLLVLESDADRERFGVKRRFRMRDGEQFFAKGRDNANYELLQKQMKRAGTWRLGLRSDALRLLGGLGRDARLFQPTPERRIYTFTSSNTTYDLELGDLGIDPSLAVGAAGDESGPLALDKLEEPVEEKALKRLEEDTKAANPEPLGEDWGGRGEDPIDGTPIAQEDEREFPGLVAQRQRARLGGLKPLGLGGRSGGEFFGYTGWGLEFNKNVRRGGPYRVGTYWLDNLFPQLPPLPHKAKETKSDWPEAARELAHSLLRTGKLAKLAGGLEIVRQTETFDPRWDVLTGSSRRTDVYAPGAWLTRSESDRSETLVHWCDGRERGVFSKAFLLGRVWASTPEEAHLVPLDSSDHSVTPLDEAYRGYAVKVEPQGQDRATLVLHAPASPDVRIEVDTARHVLLSIEDRVNGKVTSRLRFDDFTEAAGCWWARKVETFDAQEKRTSLVTQTVRELTAEATRQQLRQELAGREQVAFVQQPLPSVADAKRSLNAGKASFSDRIALVRHFAASQQWTRALEHLEKAEELAKDKAGMRWLRDGFLNASRRHEELRKRSLAEAERLARAEKNSDVFALADHVVAQAAGLFPAGEMLELLDRLRPLYEARPAQVQAMKQWHERRAANLWQLGRGDEALAVQKQLALDCPHDLETQRQYVYAVANNGDRPAAYAWLKRLGVGLPTPPPEARWTPAEEETLYDVHADLLTQEGRYADLVEFLAGWVKREPATVTAYARYLSALVHADQADRADTLIARWLQEGQVEGERPAAVNARLQAALAQALGRGHNLYTNRIDERWLEPLGKAARYFLRRDADLHLATQIMQPPFMSSDEYGKVQQEVAQILTTDLDRLSLNQLSSYLQWMPPGRPADWKRILANLGKRWAEEKNPDSKNGLGNILMQALSSAGTADELLAFLRRELREGPEAHRTGYAAQLFQTLLGQPWSEAVEDEAFGLLDRLGGATAPADRLRAQVVALYQLTDSMVRAREAALMKKLEHPEKLPRTELKKKQDENVKLARTGLADHLRKEAGKHGKARQPWLTAERLYLDVLAGRDPKQAAADCWAFLGEKPPTAAEADPDEEQTAGRLDDVLHNRYLMMAAHLAVQKGAESLAERLLRYLDKGVAADTEDGRWKSIKYQVLVALDRPKELERALTEWVRADDPDNRWRTALAYLLAEQGHIPEAIGHLEAVAKKDELGPAAYRTLADWYMVAGRREQHDQTLVNAYKTLDEYNLSRLINAQLRPWQSDGGQVPSELDKEVLLMFQALFEKSGAPGNHLWQLQQFYQATRDFRLLAVLADSVVGHSAGRVYPFLQAMQGIITDIHEEATVDELCAHIARLRARAQTAVDRRALDLLEALVRRRAVEQKNQPGQHTEAALRAFQAAFKHSWSDGEPRLYADLLASLGAISQEPLAKEQLRQLETLHRDAKAGSGERLHLARRLSETLWAYNRREQAMDLLQGALEESAKANGGVLPDAGNEPLQTLVTFCENAGRHDRGEKVLLAQIEHPHNPQHGLWLRERLFRLYHGALGAETTVSLGRRETLYRALEGKLRDALATDDNNHRYALLSVLCGVYRTAGDKKLAGVQEDVRAFAFKQLAGVLKSQTNNYDQMVNEVAAVVRVVLGPADAIAFLLDRVEHEPAWLRYNGQEGWSRYGYSLAQWRWETTGAEGKVRGSLPADVEARLLKFVLAELRRDLESRQARNRPMYSLYQGGAYYWKEKEAEFTKVAEDVLARKGQTAAAVEYVAEYLAHGVGKRDRAIEVLEDAHRRKLLGESGIVQLLVYLQDAGRYGASIPLLVPLVKDRPDNLDYRVRLMRAYFHTDQRGELLAQLASTDAFFHEKDRWTEPVIATLARSTLETRLPAKAVLYFQEAVGRHEREQPRHGQGDAVLSGYYADLARAFSGLGKTAEAVDAAGNAIVSWGPYHQQRDEAVKALLQVLREAKDLDGYVTHLNKQTAETGLDNPVVRKALGQVYAEQGKHREAITQLQSASDIQPNDAETQRLLVAELDKAGDTEGAYRQLLQAVQLARRDIKLYQEMGKRLALLDRPREVERAYTSIVEMLPNEAESHALLAEVRQEQGRWAEAIAQWEEVARLRALEPTGLLKLAAAQVHEQRWDDAAATVQKLRARAWPPRFGDVGQQVRELERRIRLKKE
jgi:tetratricopeptide (TPR) repeat protein